MNDSEEIVDSSFDYVVIAFPVFNKMTDSDICIEFSSINNLMKQEMQETVVLLIYGKLFFLLTLYVPTPYIFKLKRFFWKTILLKRISNKRISDIL